MMQFNSRELRLLIATVALGLIAILQLGALRPLFDNMRRLNTKRRMASVELQHIQSVLARRSQVESSYEAIRNRITSTRNAEQEIMGILLTVQKAAQAANVEILENAHIKDEKAAYFNVHTVRFRGRGEAESLVRMVHELQDPELLLKIPQMEFTIKNYKLEVSLEITRVVCEAQKNG
jgi:hypothetical protein